MLKEGVLLWGLGVFCLFLAKCSYDVACLAPELQERPRWEASYSSEILAVLKLYAARVLSDKRGVQVQTKNQEMLKSG